MRHTEAALMPRFSPISRTVIPSPSISPHLDPVHHQPGSSTNPALLPRPLESSKGALTEPDTHLLRDPSSPPRPARSAKMSPHQVTFSRIAQPAPRIDISYIHATLQRFSRGAGSVAPLHGFRGYGKADAAFTRNTPPPSCISARGSSSEKPLTRPKATRGLFFWGK
jgi:hypothetical protein